MESQLVQLQLWMQEHAAWTGFIVFLVAMTESLAVVGILVPGAFLMVTAGTMIGAGMLGFWSTVTWAIAGAIIGDNLSFWLGYYYRDRIRCWWPFSRYPNMLEQGKQFFQKHGGKSIALGRFVGPIRAVIPVIAGLMEMRPWTFFFINVVSAIGWAPAYLLPGIILGTSLKLASEVAGRLVVFLLAAVLLLWFTYWLAKMLYRLIEPHAEQWMATVLLWGGQNRFTRLFTATIVDPDQPEVRGLFSWALATIVMVWLVVITFDAMLSGGLSAIDNAMVLALHTMQNPIGDHVMVMISFFGHNGVLLPPAVILAVYLTVRGQFKTAAHWLAAIGFAIVGACLIALLNGDRSVNAIAAHVDTSVSTAFYGFFAVLSARHLRERWRAFIYASATVLVTSLATAKIYLTQIEFTTALASLALAGMGVVILGVAYRRHYSALVSPGPMLLLTFLSVLLCYALVTPNRYTDVIALASPQLDTRMVAYDRWRPILWRELPTYRETVFGPHHPLNVQFAGDFKQLDTLLQSHQWRHPVPDSIGTILLWISPQFTFERLPILPHVFQGRNNDHVLIKPAGSENLVWVLRLWRSGIMLAKSKGENEQLWIGNVSRLSLVRPWGLFARPKTGPDFDIPLQTLLRDLPPDSVQLQRRPAAYMNWRGDVLLLELNAWRNARQPTKKSRP